MRDIKTKSRDKSIKVLDKKDAIEHFVKKASITKKVSVNNTTGNSREDTSQDANKGAVDTVIGREKKAVVDSAYRMKRLRRSRSKRKHHEAHNSSNSTRDRSVDISTKVTSIEKVTKEKRSDIAIKGKSKSKVQANQVEKIDHKKIRLIDHRKSHSSNKIDKAKKQHHYQKSMMFHSIRKHKEKVKKASQATTTTKKGAILVGKTVKGSIKVMTKSILSIQHLISMGGALILLIVITLFIGVFASLSSDSNTNTATKPLSPDVLAYTEVIKKYAKEYEIEEYVPLVQAVMMQESAGKGTDPMQSSECGFNKKYPQVPNGITNPEYSIEVGIQNLADCMENANVTELHYIDEISLALQGYNYGQAYISWAITNFDGYTKANAKVYSDEMKAKLHTSVYGDPEYVPHVLQYYHLGNGKIVDVALSQVGNIGGKPYWSWYGFESRVEWCACFVSWCANEAGLIESGMIPKFAYCPTGIKWFKDQGRWQNQNYTPAAGDIIFFDWQNDGVSDHVGIVEKVENEIVYTIEGNSLNDECRINTYSLNSINIVGYGKLR